jgi:two-component system response regulator
MHRTYICDVERGSRNVSLETIDRLARALEVSTSILFDHSLKPVPDKSAMRPVSSDALVDILLVEDDPNDVTLALQALGQANLANHIQVVRDGAAALDFLFCAGDYLNRSPASLPQVILLDLNLPKVHGLEVLRRIKEHPRTSAIPVVVLTASNRSQDLVESQRLGAKAYIVKPVDFRNFSAVVPKLNLQWAVLKPTPALRA